jgi:ferredoxin
VVQTPRCLAALSVPTLLELATTGKSLWLNDSLCHTCPIGEARHHIQLGITAANRWLEVMGHDPAIYSHLDAAGQLDDEPSTRPLVRGDHLVLSRRDLFKSLRGRARQGATGLMADGDATHFDAAASTHSAGLDATHGDADEGPGHPLAHHIPANRQQLARALRRLSPDPATRVPTPDLPIADVVVGDSCTACGLCAQFCPSEAIVFLSDGEYYVLHFSAALCLGDDCSLCIIGCPTDAVRFGQEVIADELLSTQPRPVKAGRLAPCPRCGALTDAPMEDEKTVEVPLCYVCQTQSARSDLLANNQPES